ncbi:MAG: BON domain-containing protein [Candidatus Acidiferrum sp.]
MALTNRILRSGIAAAVVIGMGVWLSCSTRTFAGQQQPDNTGANKQNGVTADQQKNDAADRELAQKIRQSLMEDKSISTYGHNVKVIVRNGQVTLKGPVASEAEKKTIESKAADLAGGPDKVSNKLKVKS